MTSGKGGIKMKLSKDFDEKLVRALQTLYWDGSDHEGLSDNCIARAKFRIKELIALEIHGEAKGGEPERLTGEPPAEDELPW